MGRLPHIAVTIGVESTAWRAEEDRGRYLPYAAALRDAGGEPIMVGLECAAAALADPRAFLQQFDGLLLTGGGDIHPASYPNPPSYPGCTWEQVIKKHNMHVDAGRDAFELALARAAFDAEFPVLGICRGFQVLNVALGGRLILDLDGHRARPDRTSSHHSVCVLSGTLFSAVLGRAGEMQVNSRHHQGVDAPRLAPLLRPAATADNGRLIEALEAPENRRMLAVQWHPERSEDPESYRNTQPLFEWFLSLCREGPR